MGQIGKVHFDTPLDGVVGDPTLVAQPFGPRPRIGGPPPLGGTEEHGWQGRPVAEDPRWDQHAACKGQDPAIWFPGRGESVKEAKAVCAVCPVREPCLEFALEHSEKFGIWGGLSERERRRVRKTHVLADRTCPVCGTSFAPRNRKHRICTTACGSRAANRRARGRAA